MPGAEHVTTVAKFVRLLDSPNEPEAQVALRKLRSYCKEHDFRLTEIQIGPAMVRIELPTSDDSARRTIKIVEEQQTKTQDYCAFLERQVEDLTKRLAEVEARPRRNRKRKKATA